VGVAKVAGVSAPEAVVRRVGNDSTGLLRLPNIGLGIGILGIVEVGVGVVIIDDRFAAGGGLRASKLIGGLGVIARLRLEG
ncbi:hypothetical protein DEV91_1551, partial [Phyllobacterium brassicacearum]|uniref:hypothetical protein n=1 Tax=Phyllobacterium brassicacearum TaxID=314235 RepID=UPI0010D22797